MNKYARIYTQTELKAVMRREEERNRNIKIIAKDSTAALRP